MGVVAGNTRDRPLMTVRPAPPSARGVGARGDSRRAVDAARSGLPARTERDGEGAREVYAQVAEFEELAFRPPFMVFFALSVAESVSLIWSGRLSAPLTLYTWRSKLDNEQLEGEGGGGDGRG